MFLDAAPAPLYGLEIAKEAGIKSGSLYPILDRLESAGWLVGEWESVDPTVEGRPRRRHYQLTSDGAVGARQAAAEASIKLVPKSMRLGWKPA